MATKEKMLQMVDDILNEGGLCYTKEDVDKIMEDRKCLERLKVQIRYRKFVMNEKHLNVKGMQLSCIVFYFQVWVMTRRIQIRQQKRARKQ